MKSVLYLHGLASSPAGAKIMALKPMLAPHDIELNVPDLNVPSFERLDYDAMCAHALDVARRTPPRAIVGSSLGALVALRMAPEIAVPMVFIAPAVGVADRWYKKIPAGDPVLLYNFAREAQVPIHRAFFDRMSNEFIDNDPPPSRVTVIMGRRDETVPFAVVEKTWKRWTESGRLAPGSKFIELEDGDHTLVSHVELIRDAIIEAAS